MMTRLLLQYQRAFARGTRRLFVFIMLLSSLLLAPNLAAQEGRKIHVVKTGDTLFSLARTYSVSVADLRNWNDLGANRIAVGDTLVVSQGAESEPAPPASPISSPGGISSHTVTRGETLYGIARKYGLSVSELRELNNLGSNALRAGQVLSVRPGNETTSTATTVTAQPSSGRHTVTTGETLFSIARKYGLSVPRLRELNNLSGSSIQPGQELRVSAGPAPVSTPAAASPSSPGTDLHTVRPGETLFGIARRFDMTVAEISRLNGLSGNTLAVGQSLKVTGASTQFDSGLYTVKSGETLSAIARKFGLDVARLKSINDLQDDDVKSGQILIVADNSAPAAAGTHVVTTGETLYSIATRYGVSVDELQILNGGSFHGRILRPGERIKLPGGARATSGGPRQYTVRPGDTMTSIARRNGISVASVLQANPGAASGIVVGQNIKLPLGEGQPLDIGDADDTGKVLVYDLPKGRGLASGEKYNPDQLTASHATLPFDTVVLLLNKQTGRTTFAKINDRGPLETGFFMDVTPKVADALGITRGSEPLIEYRIVSSN